MAQTQAPEPPRRRPVIVVRPNVPPADPFGDEDQEAMSAALFSQMEVEEAAKVSKESKEKHRSFLKTDDSGIAKLIPSEKTLVLDAAAYKKAIPRDAAFFSFLTRQHHRDQADLRFHRGKLLTAEAMDSLGFIKPLGETPITGITIETPEAAAMLAMPLPKDRLKAEEMQESAVAEAEPVIGRTYLLRSAHSGYHDQIIAFQVVGTEEDGGVVIIWKRIYKGKSTKFDK